MENHSPPNSKKQKSESKKPMAVRLFLPDLHAAAADTNLELWAKLAMDVLSNQLCLPG